MKNKEHEFKQRVLEERIFEKIKDSIPASSHELRRRYKDINITRLRTKIINYQIDTYGEELGAGSDYVCPEENLRRSRQAKQRKYAYRHRG